MFESLFHRKPSWLGTIPAEHVSGKVWKVNITGYGEAYVGPYGALSRFLTRQGQGEEAHHIVGMEHLADLAAASKTKSWSYTSAPAVGLLSEYHQKVLEKRKTAEQTYLGGRATKDYDRPSATISDIQELYANLYDSHLATPELFDIAKGIIQSKPPAEDYSKPYYRSC